MRSLFVIPFYVLFTCYSFAGIRPFVQFHKLKQSNSVNHFEKLFIDNKQLVWLMGNNELISFDGKNSYVIPFGKLAKNDRINAIYQRRNGEIWFGTSLGQIAYIKNDSITFWEPEEGLPQHSINSIGEDIYGQLFIGTAGEGLYVLHKEYVYHFGLEDGLADVNVNAILDYFEDGVAVATDEGIQWIAMHHKNKYITNLICDVPVSKMNTNIFRNNQDIYLVSLSNGIWKWDTDCFAFLLWQPSDTSSTILKSLPFSHDEVLVMDEENMWIYPSHKYLDLPEIKSNTIKDIRRDVFGIIWILNNKNELFSFNTHFYSLSKIQHSVQAVLTEGKYSYVCTSQGLSVYNFETDEIEKQILKDVNLISITKDHYGRLWVGAFGDGVYVLDPHSFKILYHYKEGEHLTNGSVFSICSDSQYVWLATLGGLVKIQNQKNIEQNTSVAYDKVNGLPTNFIYHVTHDQDGKLWLSTDGKGCFNFDWNANEVYYPINWNTSSIIYSSLAENGYFFINNADKGIQMLGTDSVFHQIKSYFNELESFAVYNSLLLCCGNNRLIWYNLKDSSSQIINFTSYNSKATFTPNLNAIYCTQDGHTFIGAEEGLFRLEQFERLDRKKPFLYFTQSRCMDEVINMTKPGEFEHDKNFFTFNFRAVQYNATDQLQHRYRLIHYERSWRLTQETSISYSDLPPGEYELNIQSSIDEDFSNAAEITYAFKIMNPFWASWWFILGCSVLLFVLISFIIRSRDAKLRRNEEIKRYKAETNYELLKTQVNPHFLFNSFNSVLSLIEEDPKRAKEYVEKLSDYFRNIMEYRNKESVGIDVELEILKNYVELLKIRFPKNLSVNIQPCDKNIRIVPLTLQLLLENAVKHNEISDRHPLHVTITCDDHYIWISNPIKLKTGKVESTSFGLDSIRERYKVLTNEEIIFEITDRIFSVKIPILR